MGNVAGVMSKKHARALSNVLEDSVRYEGVVLEEHLGEKMQELEINPGPVQANMDVIIYGDPQLADSIARKLSSLGLYLQRPHQTSSSIPYENPQFLELPDVVIPDVEMNVTSSACITPGSSQIDSDTPFWAELEHSFADFNLIFNEIPQHDYLTATGADFRVRTPLLQ